MISILIPIYNQDCTALIKELLSQMSDLTVASEIVAIDDASVTNKENNKQVLQNSNCTYIELSDNIGRSAIRNKLSAQANFPYLLFIDCDTFPNSKNFLQNYVDFIHHQKSNKWVSCGGYKYEKQIKNDTFPHLRWKYGKYREELKADIRNKSPYKSFSSFNFLIPAEVFHLIKFNENITGYGHEDTYFGISLMENHVEVKHIDNEMKQIFIDDTALYIEKTKNAVKNLYLLYENTENCSKFEHIKLVLYYKKTKALRLTNLMSFIFKIFNRLILKNLYSKTPSLWLFDIYRLSMMCYYKVTNIKK